MRISNSNISICSDLSRTTSSFNNLETSDKTACLALNSTESSFLLFLNTFFKESFPDYSGGFSYDQKNQLISEISAQSNQNLEEFEGKELKINLNKANSIETIETNSSGSKNFSLQIFMDGKEIFSKVFSLDQRNQNNRESLENNQHLENSSGENKKEKNNKGHEKEQTINFETETEIKAVDKQNVTKEVTDKAYRDRDQRQKSSAKDVDKDLQGHFKQLVKSKL